MNQAHLSEERAIIQLAMRIIKQVLQAGGQPPVIAGMSETICIDVP